LSKHCIGNTTRPGKSSLTSSQQQVRLASVIPDWYPQNFDLKLFYNNLKVSS
jgi:hypothetical protein